MNNKGDHMTKVLEDRLALLDTLELHSGSHEDFDSGHCAKGVSDDA